MPHINVHGTIIDPHPIAVTPNIDVMLTPSPNAPLFLSFDVIMAHRLYHLLYDHRIWPTLVKSICHSTEFEELIFRRSRRRQRAAQTRLHDTPHLTHLAYPAGIGKLH